MCYFQLSMYDFSIKLRKYKCGVSRVITVSLAESVLPSNVTFILNEYWFFLMHLNISNLKPKSVIIVKV